MSDEPAIQQAITDSEVDQMFPSLPPREVEFADELGLDARSIRMDCLRLAVRNADGDANAVIIKARVFANFVLAAKRGE